MPTTLQNDAGMRSEPPRSEPVASHAWPDASAAALPPDDPPAESRVSYGLRVAPWRSLNVLAPATSSGQLVMPITTAPFSSRVATIRSDARGT